MRNEMEKGRAKEKLKKFGGEVKYVLGRTVLGIVRGFVDVKPDTGLALQNTLDRIPHTETTEGREVDLPNGHFTDWGPVVDSSPPSEPEDPLPPHAREAIDES